MKKLLLTFFTFVVLIFATNGYSQILSNGTGGGDWNTITTWQGGAIPGVSDNVVILGNDIVTLAAAGTCANLTLNANATLSLNASALVIPGSSWNFDAASTVIYSSTTTVQSAMTYGNLVYSNTSNGTPNGNLTIAGNLSITGGTLRGNSGTSGSFIHTVSGNVLISGTSSRLACVTNTSATTASCTWNIAGNVSLTGNNSGNRIILYESAGPHSGSAVVNIDGNLSVGSSSRLEFKSSSSTTNDFPLGIINLKGNLVMNGNWNVSSASAGTSPGFQFNFVGISAQDWSGVPSYSVTGFDLNININNAAGITLSSPLSIAVSRIYLNFVNGNLTTSSTNLLTVGTSGNLSAGSSSSFVNGPLAHTIGSVGPTVKSFPIGKGTDYRPLNLTITQDAATATLYTAEMFNAAPPARPLGIFDHVSSTRYYTITQGVGANVTAAALQLSYGADDGVFDVNIVNIAKGDGANAWSDLGGDGTGLPTGSITSTTNFTTFSDFVLAFTGPVPVELTAFSAKLYKSDVMLNWTTATETNNYGWDIEMRKNSSAAWQKIGFVNGAGNSNSPKEYSYVHKLNNENGSLIYRLKQVDIDGKITYSKEVAVDVKIPVSFTLSQNYPNPFNPNTNIDYTLPFKSEVILSVYSVTGEKIVDIVNEEQPAGYYSYQFGSKDLNLTSGIYIYKLTAVSKSNEAFTLTKKMLLVK